MHTTETTETMINTTATYDVCNDIWLGDYEAAAAFAAGE